MKNIENDAYGHFPYLIAVRIRDISGSDKNNVIYPQCTKCSEHNFFARSESLPVGDICSVCPVADTN